MRQTDRFQEAGFCGFEVRDGLVHVLNSACLGGTLEELGPLAHRGQHHINSLI